MIEEVTNSTSGESSALNNKVTETTESISEVSMKKHKLHSDLDNMYEKMLQTESDINLGYFFTY